MAEIEVKKGSSGIPAAVFVEDVDAFMKQAENDNAEQVLRRLDELHQKYKYLEMNLTTKKKRLRTQIPEIKTSLDTVKYLREQKESVETQFLLSDSLYVKADVAPTQRVCLWLGANVMLEYTLDEADDLLSKNLKEAKELLDNVEADLGYLRDQTTTTEVSMARVYNWDVIRRQAERSVSGEASAST